jgi:serine protease
MLINLCKNKKKLFSLLLSVTLNAGAQLKPGALGYTQKIERPIESIIVKFRPESSLNKQQRIEKLTFSLKAAAHDIQALNNGAFLVKIHPTSLSQVNTDLERLKQNPAVLYAEADQWMETLQTPSNTRYPEQWHYYEDAGGADLPNAWDLSTGDPNIVVGVIDTGITKHKNLAPNVLPGKNFVKSKTDTNGPDDPTDQGGDTGYHGSHVAGTIAASERYAKGVVGVAWNAKILPVRVLGDEGYGNLSGIIEGMRWAAGLTTFAPPRAARVLNLSLGGRGACGQAMQETINDLNEKGVIVVVAAGNESMPARYSTPGNCKGVITVAATNRNGSKAYYTNYGKALTIAAPGGEQRSAEEETNGILSTGGEQNYVFMQGTSMATPHVAGVVALMVSLDPSLGQAEVTQLLQKGARGDVLGVGALDAYKTLELTQAHLSAKQEAESDMDVD